MHDLNFIDYSEYFNKEVKAYQVLDESHYKSIELNKYRSIVLDKISIDINSLSVPIQVHSNNVRFVNESGFFKNTDGLITDNSSIILSLQTADCLPIFLFDQSRNIKGLVHSGWKGTKNKIIKNALDIMINRGSILSDIFIVIGASIHKCCYEIGDELAPLFNTNCIYVVDGKKYLSLQEQILLDLSKLHIPKENIYVDDKCTFMDIRLSSYRRDKTKAGRMLSFLGDF